MADTGGLGILFLGGILVALAVAKAMPGPAADAINAAGSAAGAGVSTLVQLLAEAIAAAEGFYRSGTIAQRQNNPGNITDAATGSILNFPSLQDGWNALYKQIQLMFSGSTYYNSGMSISEIGRIYANNDPNWSANVAAYLGVPESTTLDELSAQYGG